MRIRQDYAVQQLANEYFHSADQNVLSHIHGFLTSDEIPSRPKCIRHGCTNISAPNPDARKRRGVGNDHETCNEPACANRCAWHSNGERCPLLRVKGRKFCGGTSGCTQLFKGGARQWEAEKRQRERAGEKFV